MTLRTLRRPAVLIPAGIVTVVVLAVAGALFQPWKLFVDETVNEAAPLAAPAAEQPDTADPAATPASPAQPEVLARGRFISHEHQTTGRVRILRLPDGERVLRIQGLRTSNGPDLKVWLAAAPVIAGNDGWFVFDDDAHVDLGPLKGNLGNQNYTIPRRVDLDEYGSVSIWCDRFSVSFGAAELRG